MLWFKQLEFSLSAPVPPSSRGRGRDAQLEAQARGLLALAGADSLGAKVRVEWSGRLRSAAGRAEFPAARILLNPRLRDHADGEIDRTLRHELAHLLAHFRAGRRRIEPHGAEWRRACSDLGIGDEKRCHTLPFPIRRLARKHHYVCPHCRRDFPRARAIKGALACLACCRAFNDGRYDARYRLRRVDPPIR